MKTQETNSNSLGMIGGIMLLGLIGFIAKMESARTSLEYRNEYKNIQAAQCETLTATRHATNGVDYLSIPLNGKVVQLFYHNGTYYPISTIKQLESEKAQRQAESNLTERLRASGAGE